jgi:hypothetical protein
VQRHDDEKEDEYAGMDCRALLLRLHEEEEEDDAVEDSGDNTGRGEDGGTLMHVAAVGMTTEDGMTTEAVVGTPVQLLPLPLMVDDEDGVFGVSPSSPAPLLPPALPGEEYAAPVLLSDELDFWMDGGGGGGIILLSLPP